METTIASTPKTSSPLGVVSLLFGISAFTILPLIGALAAIFTGKMALKEEPGNSLAQAGIFLGWLSLGLFAIAAVLMVLGILFMMPVSF